MIKVGVYEAKTQLSRLIEKSLEGEVVIISRGKNPVVKLVPMGEAGNTRSLGTARGKVTLSEDFFDPLDDFKEYT